MIFFVNTFFLLWVVAILLPYQFSDAYAVRERKPALVEDEGALILFDFNKYSDPSDWIEVSDTTRSAGKSKAIMTIVEAETVRRAVFFALLNPLPDTACFAGMRKFYDTPQDWSEYLYIVMNRVRNQGENTQYKFIIQDDKSLHNSSLIFEGFFDVTSFPEDDEGFIYVTYPLDKVLCTYHGKYCNLQVNTTQIYSVGLQIAGGVYIENMDQYGPATLEIDRMELVRYS